MCCVTCTLKDFRYVTSDGVRNVTNIWCSHGFILVLNPQINPVPDLSFEVSSDRSSWCTLELWHECIDYWISNMARNFCCRLFPFSEICLREGVSLQSQLKITIFVTINTRCYVLFCNLLLLLTEIHSSSAGDFMFLSLQLTKRFWYRDILDSV